jgi:hypothetical protein
MNCAEPDVDESLEVRKVLPTVKELQEREASGWMSVAPDGRRGRQVPAR